MHEEPAADPASVLTATAVWPFPAHDRASAALRGQLRELNLDRHQAAGGLPSDVPALDWTTLTVSKTETDIDHRGRVWFHYTATVSAAPLLRGAHRFQMTDGRRPGSRLRPPLVDRLGSVRGVVSLDDRVGDPAPL